MVDSQVSSKEKRQIKFKIKQIIFPGSGRGGRGGRMGTRGGPGTYRDQNHRNNYRNNNQDQQEIDNWDPSSTQVTNNDTNKNDETWGDCGDWDNEEYTGSLSDTKVFTPSGATGAPGGQDLAAPPGLEQQTLNPPLQNDVQYSATVVSSTATAAALNNGGSQYDASASLRQALDLPSATLSAEQSQYFTSLGSQNNNSAYSSSVQYSFNDQVSGQQAPRQQQQRARARVPPPSKIPSSAVEMPGDGLNVYLGVQFGELDFGTGGTEESYETEKYPGGIDQSAGDDYASSKGTGVSKGSQSTGLGGLQDSISSSAQADLTSGYSQRNPNSSITGAQSGLDQLTKPADIYNHATGASTGGNYQNLSYSAAQKSAAGGYQTGGYGTNAYNSSQSSNNYPPSTQNAYGYNQNSYQQQNQSQTQSSTGQQQTQTTGSSGVSSGTASQSNNNSSGWVLRIFLRLKKFEIFDNFCGSGRDLLKFSVSCH